MNRHRIHSGATLRYLGAFLLLALIVVTARAADFPGPRWVTATPAEAGLSEAKLVLARDYALTGGGSGCILGGGKLLFSWGDLKQRYDLKSTTKSFGAAALGLAIKDGKLRLSDNARSHHPTLGLPPEFNAGTGWLDEITIRHLASQTAGFDKAGGYVPLLFKPGTEWSYSDSGSNWLAECITLEEDSFSVRAGTIMLSELAARQTSLSTIRGAEPKDELAWRPLPLITDGHIDNSWCHVGWGGFAVDGDSLRAECDPRGLGLLVYKNERFGNCQLRVVFKTKEAKSNSGVVVRMADGILDQVTKPGAAFNRDAAGKISAASMKAMMASAEREEGPWFAVHRGYEVQIMDANDPLHRTGAIYSLAASSAISNKPPDEWKTLVITLAANRILVDLDGRRITSFDPENADLPRERKWFEPKRAPRRPDAGYIGLQNHDPGDVVWFREVSVRPIPAGESK